MPVDLDPSAALERARLLAARPGRHLLGITGAPGSGKSTLAATVAAEVEGVVVVPMDGFHLSDDELARLGRSDRKGAPDTFDVHGYVALLRRLRDERDHAVYGPLFDRSREESVAGAVVVRPEHRLVVTEGNYLLLHRPGWSVVRSLLDEVWYAETAEPIRLRRLVDRHVRHGRTREAAEVWVARSDEANARLVEGTRDLADAVVAVG